LDLFFFLLFVPKMNLTMPQLADLQADSTVERFQMLEQLQQLRDQLSEQSALAASAASVSDVVAAESNQPTNQSADDSSTAEPAVAAQIDSRPVASESVSAVQHTEQETSAAACTQDDESAEVIDAPDQLPASNVHFACIFVLAFVCGI
jgi:plasmid replication initiation protein